MKKVCNLPLSSFGSSPSIWHHHARTYAHLHMYGNMSYKNICSLTQVWAHIYVTGFHCSTSLAHQTGQKAIRLARRLDTLPGVGSGLIGCHQGGRIRPMADIPSHRSSHLISGFRIRREILHRITIQFMGSLKFHYDMFIQEIRIFHHLKFSSSKTATGLV